MHARLSALKVSHLSTGVPVVGAAPFTRKPASGSRTGKSVPKESPKPSAPSTASTNPVSQPHLDKSVRYQPV